MRVKSVRAHLRDLECVRGSEISYQLWGRSRRGHEAAAGIDGGYSESLRVRFSVPVGTVLKSEQETWNKDTGVLSSSLSSSSS